MNSFIKMWKESINKIVFSEQFCVDWELYLEKVPQDYWARMQYWSQELLKKHNKFEVIQLEVEVLKWSMKKAMFSE